MYVELELIKLSLWMVQPDLTKLNQQIYGSLRPALRHSRMYCSESGCMDNPKTFFFLLIGGVRPQSACISRPASWISNLWTKL